MLAEYDGLPLDRAVAKIKAKPFHDAEDVQFVRARAEYFTPEEFAAITGGKAPEAPQGDAAAPSDADAAPAGSGAPADAQGAQPGDVNPDAHTKDELQAMAAELSLDTAGTKAELAARISEARKAA